MHLISRFVTEQVLRTVIEPQLGFYYNYPPTEYKGEEFRSKTGNYCN